MKQTNEKEGAGVAGKSADAKQLGGWVLGGHCYERGSTGRITRKGLKWLKED